MSDAPKDLPPCIWCGNESTTELTTSTAPARERTFECTYCRRVFCVVFMPAEAAGSEGPADG